MSLVSVSKGKRVRVHFCRKKNNWLYSRALEYPWRENTAAKTVIHRKGFWIVLRVIILPSFRLYESFVVWKMRGIQLHGHQFPQGWERENTLLKSQQNLMIKRLSIWNLHASREKWYPLLLLLQEKSCRETGEWKREREEKTRSTGKEGRKDGWKGRKGKGKECLTWEGGEGEWQSSTSPSSSSYFVFPLILEFLDGSSRNTSVSISFKKRRRKSTQDETAVKVSMWVKSACWWE